MNYLILVNPAKDYKNFFFGIAKALQRAGHNVCYAVDSRRSSYVDPIAEIDNGENTFFFDKYFERNSHKSNDSYAFDCTWGEYFYSDFDRFLVQGFNLGRERQFWEKARACLDQFFEEIIVENQIDVVLYENVSNSFEYAAYRIAQNKGVLYLGLMGARIPGRFEIQSSVIEAELAQLQKFRRTSPTIEELGWFQEYQANLIDIQPDYMKSNGLSNVSLSRLASKKNIRKAIKLISASLRGHSLYDYANGSPVGALKKAVRVGLKRKLNASFAQKFYLSEKELARLTQQDTFYVYPIHYHPESSTSVLAPNYTDEFHNILNISNALPFGTYLYVKDHASAVGVQDRAFYRRVSALPAVKLISPNQNIKKLITLSKGVITVNSTAGYEALMLGKPVYLLGRVFYEEFANVHKLTNFSDITSSIQKSPQHKDVAVDVIAYYRYTKKGVLDFTKSHIDTNYFDSIAKSINMKAKELNGE